MLQARQILSKIYCLKTKKKLKKLRALLWLYLGSENNDFILNGLCLQNILDDYVTYTDYVTT